ncbi:MAG: DUF5837 family cyanobactin class RiPP [Rivularia sp. (in: cyanobacteria)]
MEKKNIIPQAAKPVVRVSSGTQADLLAELSEEVLGTSLGVEGANVDKSCICLCCSYDGDDAE